MLESSFLGGPDPVQDNGQVAADLHDAQDDDDEDDDNDEDDTKQPKLTVDPKDGSMAKDDSKAPVYHVKAYEPPDTTTPPATTTTPAAPPTTSTVVLSTPPPAPATAPPPPVPEEKSEAEKQHEADIEKAKRALEAARSKYEYENNHLEAFTDEESFDAKVDSEVRAMSNETQSPALSGFLGELRQEMRAYARPDYPGFLEARAEKAEKKVNELEAELATMQGKSKASVERDSKRRKTEAKGGDDEDDDDESSSDSEVRRKAGETWALSFFANIAMLAGIFGLASSKDGMIKNYTWYVIDQVVAIFLAVMYFQAFGSILSYVDASFTSVVVSSIVHALVLLALTLGLAYILRSHDLGLAVLCGAGAHVVSFCSMHAAANLQNHWVGLSYSWGMCIFGLVVLGIGLASVGYLTYTAKRKAQSVDNNSFMDKTDDLENDVAALSFSVAFTMFVRFVLTGHHPKGSDAEFNHTAGQRLSLFVYACVCLIVAFYSVKYCSKKAAESESYGVKRLMTFLNTVATMNVAWAFLYWGEWEFFENLYEDEEIKGRVMFAIISTIACGLLLVGLSKIPSTEGRVNITGKNDKMVALTALALVCAWSWELCFDAALEDMTEGVGHPVGWKVVTTLIMCGVIVPVYVMYMRPVTTPASEAIKISATPALT